MSKATTTIRKVIKANTALEVVLPIDFCRKTGISKGDEVVVSYTDHFLVVMPNPDRMKDIIKGETNHESKRD